MSRRIDLRAWEERYPACGVSAASAVKPLSWYCANGNPRLEDLLFDDAPASLALWDFVLSEESRLRAARANGEFLIGAMKDLGTVPVLAYALPRCRAFYPDGAFWLPCLQRQTGEQLRCADRLGIGPCYCPVRALLGCYVQGTDFPRPDLEICAVGATCDDFSATAQVLAGLGREILWWELPAMRPPDPGEDWVALSDGERAPASLVAWIAEELAGLASLIGRATGRSLDDAALAESIRQANRVRQLCREIRGLAFTASPAPLPAIETLLAEILALHFCSDRDRCIAVLSDLAVTVRDRVRRGLGPIDSQAVRVYWFNPVADLRVLNWLEDCGGRLCGSDFMTSQSLAPIPEDRPPLEALAAVALTDRLIGDSARRARLAANEALALGAEAVVVARIPGASHCWDEAEAMIRALEATVPIPVTEIEVPPLADAHQGQIRNRLETVMEIARSRRGV